MVAAAICVTGAAGAVLVAAALLAGTVEEGGWMG